MRTRSTFCSKGFAWGLTILVLVAINPTAMATMYRCFDAQGSVVLTDSPAQLEDCTILDPKKPTAQIAPSPIPNPAQAHPPRQHPKRASISQRYEQTKEGTTKEQSDQDNEAIDKKKEELETITVPITKIGGSMVVQVTLNGSVDAHLIVDTGATMTVLSYDIGIELGLLSGSDVSLNTVNTAGGRFRSACQIWNPSKLEQPMLPMWPSPSMIYQMEFQEYPASSGCPSSETSKSPSTPTKAFFVYVPKQRSNVLLFPFSKV